MAAQAGLCLARFVSGLVGNSRRHVLSCRGSCIIKEANHIKDIALEVISVVINNEHVLYITVIKIQQTNISFRDNVF